MLFEGKENRLPAGHNQGVEEMFSRSQNAPLITRRKRFMRREICELSICVIID